MVWSRLSTTGQRLLVTGVRLPAALRKKSKKSKAGKVTVTGPVSCMPASKGAVDGTKLAPGSKHKLVGAAKFARGGSKNTVKAAVTFRACPNG